MAGCNCNNEDDCNEVDVTSIVNAMEKLEIQEGDIVLLKGLDFQSMYKSIISLEQVLAKVFEEKKARAIGLPQGLELTTVNKNQLEQLGLTHIDDTHHTTSSVYEEGGEWIGKLRSEIQTTFLNGDSVTWGSNEVLLPEVTIGDLEKLCAAAVAADRNHRQK